jgi:hypothetical protein
VQKSKHSEPQFLLKELMAFTRNTAPPNLETSWKDFAPGDSILKSTTRFAALNELNQILIIGTREFNAANSVVLPQSQSSIDEDVLEFNGAGELEYRIDVDPVTGIQTKEYSNYLASYISWIVPTTGELEGQKSPQAAFAYMLRQVNRLNDSITPGRLFNDPRGLVTLTDEDTNSKELYTMAGLPVVASVSATGGVEFSLLEYGVISDLQHNAL